MRKIYVKYKKWILGICGIFLFSGLVFLDMLYFIPWTSYAEEVTIQIRPGTSFTSIVDSLQKYEVVQQDEMFAFLVRLRGLETSFKAGIFKIPKRSSFARIVEELTHSSPQVTEITFIEGLQARQIAAQLAKKFNFTADEFMAVVQDSQFARSLGVPAGSLEGFLFPETYKFFASETPKQVATRMVQQFFREVPDSFKNRAQVIGWDLLKAVTLGSIIEGEVVFDSERPTVSSVYHNRLKRGMRLQADPTIQYIIEDGPRRLWEKDLEIDSPYNTYRYRGLPPGPINNPGFESIRASLYPDTTSYLYFVARGDGYHTFSRTNREHINAKRKLQRIRRQVYMQHGESDNAL